jgi:TonB family protein
MASLAGEKQAPSRKEKFGKFVLLEPLDATNLGADYRAAKLGSAGLEKIVQLLRLSPALSSSADSAKVLMDHAKFAAQLQNANVLKIFGIGKVEGSYYISYEFVEGKSLKTIFNRCRSEGFPFSVDHALLIASKICSALEYAHGRKLDGGGRYFHGLVTPNNVIVSYEGEVRVRGFGYWPSGVRDLGLVGDDEVIYLAPEQASNTAGEPRSDTFAVGAILFEALTGQPLLQPDRRQDVAARISNARLQGPSGDEDALPKAIVDILQKALASDVSGRYAEIQEMRKAIDTLLFSGDFTPTTFNLAFFMHSLFREDIERESKVLKEEKEANYFDFLDDAKKTPLPETAKAPVIAPTPAPAPAPAPVVQPPPVAHAPTPLPLIPPPPPVHHETSTKPVPVVKESRSAPAVDSREAAAGFTFHKETQKKAGKSPMLAIVGGIVVLAVVGGIVFKMRSGGSSAQTAPTAAPVATPDLAAIAAQKKVAELQAQLDAMKAKQDADAKEAADKAAAEARRIAQQRKGLVTADELAKAEADARKKADEESRRKAAQQQQELETQKRAAEAEKAAADKAAADKAAAERAAAETTSAPATNTQVASNATSAPAAEAPAGGGGTVARGALVNLTDPGVVRPEYVRKVNPTYPQRAYMLKVGGTVILNALIDEEGKVTDVQILQKIDHALGPDLHNAAIASIKASKFKPATKDGVPVKVWFPVKLEFRAARDVIQ